MTNPPIACRLTDADLRARRDGMLASLRRRVRSAEWMWDGLELEFAFSDAMLVQLFDFIAAERECCSFLEFHLRTGPGSAPIRVTITGPVGSRAFLETLGLAEPERGGEIDGKVR